MTADFAIPADAEWVIWSTEPGTVRLETGERVEIEPGDQVLVSAGPEDIEGFCKLRFFEHVGGRAH